MLVTIALQKRVLNTLVIDEKGLVPDHEDQYVFVVVDGKAVKTKVLIGERRPGKVQVLEGIVQDDEVVVQGTLRIRNGSALRVLNSSQG